MGVVKDEGTSATACGGRVRGRGGLGRASGPYTSLFWRVFTTNAAVLAAACVITVLALSPGFVSSPVALQELAIFAGGVVAMLVLNLVLLRRAFAPLERLTTVMRRIDPLRPGQRVSVERERSEASELALAFNQMLERLETEREGSTRRVLAAQEAERLRVAQELHDEVGQSLTAVLLQLGRTQKRAPADLGPELREAQETARASLEDVRRIAHQLRPEALDDLGLVSALTAFSQRLSEQSGLRVTHRFARQLPPLTPEEELVMYRIAQEALTNVVRHAGGTRAELSLEFRDVGVVLRVRDDGRGLTGSSRGGGITGMYERAVLIGADLRVEEGPDEGVEVTLEVPVGQRR